MTKVKHIKVIRGEGKEVTWKNSKGMGEDKLVRTIYDLICIVLWLKGSQSSWLVVYRSILKENQFKGSYY
jgi:hypothetical protein